MYIHLKLLHVGSELASVTSFICIFVYGFFLVQEDVYHSRCLTGNAGTRLKVVTRALTPGPAEVCAGSSKSVEFPWDRFSCQLPVSPHPPSSSLCREGGSLLCLVSGGPLRRKHNGGCPKRQTYWTKKIEFHFIQYLSRCQCRLQIIAASVSCLWVSVKFHKPRCFLWFDGYFKTDSTADEDVNFFQEFNSVMSPTLMKWKHDVHEEARVHPPGHHITGSTPAEPAEIQSYHRLRRSFGTLTRDVSVQWLTPNTDWIICVVMTSLNTGL